MHGRLGRHRLGSDDIGDLEVERDIFSVFSLVSPYSSPLQQEASIQAAARGFFDLLVERRVGRGRPPAHHDGEGCVTREKTRKKTVRGKDAEATLKSSAATAMRELDELRCAGDAAAASKAMDMRSFSF